MLYRCQLLEGIINMCTFQFNEDDVNLLSPVLFFFTNKDKKSVTFLCLLISQQITINNDRFHCLS